MSSQTQVEGVQQQIADVARKVSDLEASLVAAKQAGDGGEVSFLRTQLEQLYRKDVALHEEKNLLLRAHGDTVVDVPTTQDVSLRTEEGEILYTVTLYNGRLDVKALKDTLAVDGLVLKKLNGVVPAYDENGMSRTIFHADIQAKTQAKKDEDLAEKKKLRVWNAWQWGAPAFVALIVLVIVVVRLFQGKTASVPGIPGSGR